MHLQRLVTKPAKNCLGDQSKMQDPQAKYRQCSLRFSHGNVINGMMIDDDDDDDDVYGWWCLWMMMFMDDDDDDDDDDDVYGWWWWWWWWWWWCLWMISFCVHSITTRQFFFAPLHTLSMVQVTSKYVHNQRRGLGPLWVVKREGVRSSFWKKTACGFHRSNKNLTTLD